MQKTLAFIKKRSFYFLLFFLSLILFYPLILKQQIPFSSNLLASFYNPWAQEKFTGWETGIPNKPIGLDDLRIFFPQRAFTMFSWKLGQLPLWNPYSFSGNYHIGLSETAVFYPLNILFFIFPQLPVWVFLIVIQPILAGVGMYLYIKTLLKDEKGALFGGLVFGFSGVVLVRMVEGLSVGHTLIWLPFAFWSIEAFFTKKEFRYIVLLTLSLVFSLLAGWFQFTFYICIFSFIYALFSLLAFRQNKGKFYLLVFLPYFILPLLTLYHLIPAFQTFLASPRGNFNKSLLAIHLMPPAHILTLIFPDFWGNPGSYNFFGRSEYKESILYVGVAPFILSLFSIFSLKNKKIFFFVITAVITLLLGIDNPLSRWFISLQIPVVSSFLPNRIFLVTSFSISVLSAYGITFILSRLRLKHMLIVIIPLIFSVLITPFGVFAATWMNLYTPLDYQVQITLHRMFTDKLFLVQEKNLIIPMIFVFILSLLLAGFIKWRKGPTFFVLSILLTFFGQFYFAQKYIPWSSAQFVFPKNEVFSYLNKNAGLNRFISTQEGYIPSNFPLYFHLFSPDGVSSMYTQRYGELITYMKSDGGSSNKIPRIESRIDPSSAKLFLDQDRYLLRFLSIDGIKYVVKLRHTKTGPKIPDNLSNFRLVWQNNTWQIFTYDNALPRYFWTNEYEVLPESDILSRLFSPAFNPQKIILEEKPGIDISKKSEASIKLLSYTPNKVIFDVNAKGNGLLFLSDEYVSQFKVTIDGKNTKLHRADYDFRTVAIPDGQHIITFFYDSKPEILAILTSGIMLVLAVIGISILIGRRIIKW